MKTHGFMKTWNVRNKLDKDGEPEPTIVLTFEIPFQERIATSLAKLTTGDTCSLEIEAVQRSLELAGEG